MRRRCFNSKYLLIAFAVALFAIAPTKLFGQFPPLEKDIWDEFMVSGEPVRTELGTGKYKLAYKNKSGSLTREVTYETLGSLMQIPPRKLEEKWIETVPESGKPISTSTRTFGENPDTLSAKDGPIVKDELVRYDKQGNPREKTAIETINGQIFRSVTTYPAGSGPDGVTKRERFDKEKRQWVALGPLSGKWYVMQNGKRLPGVITFTESPAISNMMKDSKQMYLIFSPNALNRSVTLAEGTADELGFSRRVVQLRGDVGSGRLEFWGTPDLSDPKFAKTGHVLVRETP